MSMKSNFFRLSVAAAAIALTAGAAQAQGYGSGRVTIEGQRGVTTIDRSASGYAGARSGSTTVTGPNGQTATRDWNRSYDPSTGTYSRNSQSTGPYGGTRSVQGSTQHTGPGEWTNSRTVTQPNGQTRSSTRWIRVE